LKIIKKIMFLTILLLVIFRHAALHGKTASIKIAADDLKNTTAAFLAITPDRNFAHPGALKKCADHIESRFKKAGIETFRQPFIVNGSEYVNICGRIGRSDKKIVVGAHYDAAPETPGADDNASGIAGLIELAVILKTHEKDLNYEIILAAYTLEEPPNFRTENMGSFIHAKSLHDAGRHVELMISLEMLGYFADAPGSQSYPSKEMKAAYPDKGNFIAGIGTLKEKGRLISLKQAFQKHTDLGCEIVPAGDEFQGIDFSDHLNYWKFGYNAIMITDTAFLRNKNYHEPSDAIETLDFIRMAEVVKGLAHFLLEY